MAKTTEIIYPREAHPATRVLTLVGTLFLISLVALLIAFSVTQIINPGKYLATLSDVVNGVTVTTSTPENTGVVATSSPESATTTEETPAAREPGVTAAPLTPGEQKTTTYPVVVSGTVSLPNGIPDLSITIIDTGIINAAGNFIRATSTNSGEQTGVVFEVSNLGTAASGPWRFTAHLPTLAGDFTSELQDSLNPGEKIRYTIGFQLLRNQGQNSVSIDVDPTRQITQEVNRNNNTVATIVIRNY